MIVLSAKQKDVLEFIESFSEKSGFPPTCREIALHMGFNSTNAAMDHLRALERKGAITRAPRVARGIRVVK